MTEQEKNNLRMAINTLNLITVNGQANLSRLLGVMQLLQQMVDGGEQNDNGVGE